MRSNFVLMLIAVAMFIVFGGTASAGTFMSDSFSYSPGQLTNSAGGANVSNGRWVGHSGQTFGDPVLVVGGAAEVTAAGSEDVHRDANQTMGAGDKWYYSAVVTVNDTRADPNSNVNNDYFMHFMPPTGFNFRGRLGLTNPAVASTTNFRFFIASTSLGSGQTNWGADLAFGGTYKVVVSWDYNTGASNLWVDPINEGSPSVNHTVPGAAGAALNGLAMRQDFIGGNTANNQVLVDGVAIGNDFISVHANSMNGSNIPEPASLALALLGLVGAGCCRRRS